MFTSGDRDSDTEREKGGWFPRGQGLTVSYPEVLPRPWPCLGLLLGARLECCITKCQLYKLQAVSGSDVGECEKSAYRLLRQVFPAN